jgi:hypothetical protein
LSAIESESGAGFASIGMHFGDSAPVKPTTEGTKHRLAVERSWGCPERLGVRF